MKHYEIPEIIAVQFSLQEMIALSLPQTDEAADPTIDVLVKDEDELTEEDLYRIFLGWD